MKKLLISFLLATSANAFAVSEITDASFEKDVINEKLPTVVDFYATWCGPCKTMAVYMERAEKDLGGKVKFVKMDIEKNPAFGGAIKSIPTVVVSIKGKPSAIAIGLPNSYESFLKWIKREALK